MRIETIFPTPVLFDNFYRELSKEEISFSKAAEMRGNISNQSSIDTYILKNPVFHELGYWIENKVKEYFLNIYNPAGNVEIYLTQSWLNHSKVGEEHHVHAHPNSIVSGVFYLTADPSVDKITFVKSVYKDIDILPVEYNQFNSNSWFFSIKPGMLLVFPSSLKHTVEKVLPSELRDTRISLSFNTFIKGHINPGIHLSELIL